MRFSCATKSTVFTFFLLQGLFQLPSSLSIVC